MSGVPERRGGVTHELEDVGTVLYDGEGRQLLVLNEVGAAVWYLMDGQRTVEEICEFILEHLPDGGERVRADVRAFLDELDRHGLVVWT